MHGSDPVYGLPSFGNRDFVSSGFGDSFNEYDYDKSENMEDESNIRIPTFTDLLSRRQNLNPEGILFYKL